MPGGGFREDGGREPCPPCSWSLPVTLSIHIVEHFIHPPPTPTETGPMWQQVSPVSGFLAVRELCHCVYSQMSPLAFLLQIDLGICWWRMHFDDKLEKKKHSMRIPLVCLDERFLLHVSTPVEWPAHGEDEEELIVLMSHGHTLKGSVLGQNNITSIKMTSENVVISE